MTVECELVFSPTEVRTACVPVPPDILIVKMSDKLCRVYFITLRPLPQRLPMFTTTHTIVFRCSLRELRPPAPSFVCRPGLVSLLACRWRPTTSTCRSPSTGRRPWRCRRCRSRTLPVAPSPRRAACSPPATPAPTSGPTRGSTSPRRGCWRQRCRSRCSCRRRAWSLSWRRARDSWRSTRARSTSRWGAASPNHRLLYVLD